ncbi:hypothetical protein ASG90_15260 [Nocardioides sp. Soil797]|nr:hypothetical protein ASG90_15260 [Nocardioides sp. Soil797]
MARKKKILLHIGPNPSAVSDLHARLASEQALLDGVGHRVAEVDQCDLDRAKHEMLRTHKDAGLKRREVDGAWARICRALLRSRADLLLSQPDFTRADDAQVALILDGLAGLDVHVVVTPSDDEEPDDLVARWSARLREGRVHVAPLGQDAAPVDLAEELVGIALCIQHAELDTRITKLKKRRKGVRSRIALREAS